MVLSNYSYSKLLDNLRPEEGYRQFPYKDTKGIETIGYGRNLKDVGVSEEEADYLLQNDVIRAISALQKNAKVFNSLDDSRKIVLIDMCVNLGIEKLLLFVNMFLALEKKDYRQAAKEMMNSIWASEVGDRAKRLSTIMTTGII